MKIFNFLLKKRCKLCNKEIKEKELCFNCYQTIGKNVAFLRNSTTTIDNEKRREYLLANYDEVSSFFSKKIADKQIIILKNKTFDALKSLLIARNKLT